LAALRPGDDIDLRGTRITNDLLNRLLNALTPEGDDTVPNIGTAHFHGAWFSKHASFDSVLFSGVAWFNGATFGKGPSFDDATFNDVASFNFVRFDKDASFDGTRFKRTGFHNARFEGRAWFVDAQFDGTTSFDGARFGGARFDGVRFSDDASFSGARLDWLTGPIVCYGRFTAARIVITGADPNPSLQIATQSLNLTAARFGGPGGIIARYAAVDLTGVVGGGPVTVVSHAVPFTTFRDSNTEMDESGLKGDPRAAVVSLSGADAANIVLADVDLSSCVFLGTHHLDQIRLVGRCLFAQAPPGWHWGISWIPARRWTRRKIIAEEVAWRVDPSHPRLARAGWTKPAWEEALWPLPVPSPARLAVIYRSLRKALEDSKDSPGASDFYYGEMEARRHDHESTGWGERILLHLYWLVSGYGLRASRAAGLLLAAALGTFFLMMLFGLPNTQPHVQLTGTVSQVDGRTVLAETTPNLALTLPFSERITGPRASHAGLIVFNAVIFRAPDTALTSIGIWIDIGSRILEPALLALAIIAARGRVHR
jgi:uncharacterized protein YjbI with pentapeptide repeats